jgi:alpha-L-fucosidase 2
MRLPVLLLLLALTARAELKSDIIFASPAGTNLTLDAFVPDGDGPFPACILVHGGAWMNGTKTSYISPLFEPLSQAKFTWFTINYRLAPQHRYPACIEDVESAIRWVKAHAAEYKADPKRIALIGESAGGHLVSLAGVRARDDTRVAAIVPFYAPHDMALRVRQSPTPPGWLAPLFGITTLDDAAWQALRDASPINAVRPGLPPYLLVHGTKDDKVPFEQSLRFQDKMKAADNTCDLITIEGGAHGMGGWDRLDPSYKQKLVEWLLRMLAPTR